MPRVKIKQLDERVATAGLHMGGGPERRKLQPGEVIDIPEDYLLPDGRQLLDVLWETGKLEMTLDPATRPLDYETYREGILCAPNFKPRDPSEATEMERAHASVKERMQAETVSEAPVLDSPADDQLDTEPAIPEPPVVADPPPRTASNRRAERRAALQAAQRGAEITS